MKQLFSLVLAAALLCGCTAVPAETTLPQTTAPELSGATHIHLGESVTVEGDTSAVTTEIPIVYYEAGHDFTYGEGKDWEVHTTEEAAAHTVVTITKPGTYVLSGSLTGQIAVDLGEDAESDPKAVVTLVLNGVDITCAVAPGVIFYNVYECADPDNPTAIVDTSAAGANVVLAAGTENVVNGSHVARIYKPDSVVLSEDGTEVAEARKLHKYDAAFYSRMSMNLDGDGMLTIHADNEGLDSEMHLTVNDGTIDIYSGNDGINTNEDGISVTTVNGGNLTVTVSGSTGEGDGIDSNGWIVINGGTVNAWACATSGDSGLDADMGIQLNGGRVFAAGNMLDKLEGSQNYAVFSFAQSQKAAPFALKNGAGETVLECAPPNLFQHLVLSAPELTGGTYTLWSGNQQFEGAPTQGGGPGFAGPIDRPDWPDRGDKNDPPPDVELPPQPTQPLVTHGAVGQAPVTDGTVPTFPEGERPEPPEGEMPELPEGFTPPEGGFAGRPQQGAFQGELSTEFEIQTGGNYFSGVQALEA